jgi:hypothetical protein
MGAAQAIGPASSSRSAASSWRRQYVIPLVACLLTFAALGAFFLLIYPLRDFRFPIGWDSSHYVWRVNAVTYDGLDRMGTIRAGTPVLLAVLMRATGQNSLTFVAIAPAFLAGVTAVAAAAMVRASLGTMPLWIPVIGIMTWIGFGRIGMVGGHLDNVLNAALVVSGFAAAVAFVAGGRGAIAATLLFMAAAVAHWPFYLFAMAVFLLGLALFAWPVLWRRLRGGDEPLGQVLALAGAAVASLGFAALTFLSRPPCGGVGIRRFTPHVRDLLRRRFLARVADGARYVAFPLAAMGGLFAARSSVPPNRLGARRLFLSLMASWLLMTIAASVAQLANIPAAGARLLHYLFAVPILAGVFVWWLARSLPRRFPRFPRLGMAGGIAVIVAALVGFGTLSWMEGSRRKPYMEARAVKEAATAGAYVERFAPGAPIVMLLDDRRSMSGRRLPLARWWRVVQASMPPDQVARMDRFLGSPDEYLDSLEQGASSGGADEPVAILIDRYNRRAFDEVSGAFPSRVVAPGVLALRGPIPSQPLAAQPTPLARTDAGTLIWLLPVTVAILLLTGSGWAIALLPADGAIRVCLAPGLGTGMLVLVAVAWDRLGLGFGGWDALGPLVATVALGWSAALVMSRNRRRAEGDGRPGTNGQGSVALEDAAARTSPNRSP